MRRIEYSPWFDADFQIRAAWYLERAGLDIADQFVRAVEATVRRLEANPPLGRRPFPLDPILAELHSVLVEKPFAKHVLFYRLSDECLTLERLIHGARDLPRRITESPYDAT